MKRNPTNEEIFAAITSGAETMFGLPIYVPLEDGFATLDIIAAQRKETNPWHIVRRYKDISFLWSPTDRGIRISDLEVQPRDWGHVDKAAANAPKDSDRHCPEGESARLNAGKHAMNISDAMVRARLLDTVDGWSSILGEVIDKDPLHGQLFKSADESINCNMLRVVCPSTGRAYIHRTPINIKTAKKARKWILLDWFEEGEEET